MKNKTKRTCLHCGTKCDAGLGMNDYCSFCANLVCDDPDMELRGRQKCPVASCENHTDQGEFVGSLCFPCYRFLSGQAQSGCSQAYRNELARFKEHLHQISKRTIEIFLSKDYLTSHLPLSDRELAGLVRG